MRIMIVGDEESKSLWDYFEPSKLEGIDLIISCGDLSPHYLSFLATFTKAPVIYVHGNHDGCYERTPPDGCICIDETLYKYRGLRILGLGGAMKYRPGPHMYSQKEMKKRVKKLRWKLLFNRGFDILVTHAPAYRFNDGDDMPHTGFEVFIKLLDKYKPKYFFHGHVHATYGGRYKRTSSYKDTQVVNAYERYIVDIDDSLIGQK